MGSPWLSEQGRLVAAAVAVVVVEGEAECSGLWSASVVRSSMVPDALVQLLVWATARAQARLDRGVGAASPVADTLATLLLDHCVERGAPFEVLACVREAWLRPELVAAAVALHGRDALPSVVGAQASRRVPRSPDGSVGPGFSPL